jgi:hypothetical protein
VLRDSRCSYLDGTGAVHLNLGRRAVEVVGGDRDAAASTRRGGAEEVAIAVSESVREMVRIVSAVPGRPFALFDGDSVPRTDRRVTLLPAGESAGTGTLSAPPSAVNVLSDSIALLDWIATQPTAASVHSGIQSYLYSSDPDLLLDRPLSHPDPDPPSDAPEVPVVVTVTRSRYWSGEVLPERETTSWTLINLGTDGWLAVDVDGVGTDER